MNVGAGRVEWRVGQAWGGDLGQTFVDDFPLLVPSTPLEEEPVGVYSVPWLLLVVILSEYSHRVGKPQATGREHTDTRTQAVEKVCK